LCPGARSRRAGASASAMPQGRGAFVAGHDDEGVARHPGVVERTEDLADCGIGLRHEVAVAADPGPAREGSRSAPRRVGRRREEVEEERPPALFAVRARAPPPRGQVPEHRFAGSRARRFRPVEAGSPSGTPGEPCGGEALDAVADDVDVGWHVERRRDPEEAVGTRGSSGRQSPGGCIDPLHLVLVVVLAVNPGRAAQPRPSALPDRRGVVAAASEERGEGQPVGLDERAPSPRGRPGEPGAPRVAPVSRP